jgi:predicted small secreted protein
MTDQGKKKFTLGMAVGVAAGMVIYRVLFGA